MRDYLPMGVRITQPAGGCPHVGALRPHRRPQDLKDAVRWSRLVRNPADAADPPKATATIKRKHATWTAEQERAFLSGTRLIGCPWPSCYSPPPGCAAGKRSGCAGKTST